MAEETGGVVGKEGVETFDGLHDRFYIGITRRMVEDLFRLRVKQLVGGRQVSIRFSQGEEKRSFRFGGACPVKDRRKEGEEAFRAEVLHRLGDRAEAESHDLLFKVGDSLAADSFVQLGIDAIGVFDFTDIEEHLRFKPPEVDPESVIKELQ